MPIKPSGQISLSEIAAEFPGTAPFRLSNYYRGGAIVPEAPVNTQVPTAGQIRFSNFYGATYLLYGFSTIPTSINEGASGTFNVTTVGVPNGTTLYWTVNFAGNLNSSDFPSSSGNFTINNNAGSFSITITADATTEGAETFTVSLRTDSVSGNVVATSNAVTINDTSLTATYAFSAPPSSVNENTTTTFNIVTANVANGTVLYWTILNNTTTNADFSATSGSFTITSNAGSFTVTTIADESTEGAETFRIEIRTGSVSGSVVITSSQITINDTSLTRGYNFGTIPTSINEGSTGTFNVTTSNVPNSTVLYWTINLAGNLTSDDFTATSGSFTITSNAGSFTISPRADITTEGAETFTVSIRTGSTDGPVVRTSNSVTINDTSLSPSYNFGTIPTSINEGSAGTFNVTTTNVSNLTTLYWTVDLSGNLTADDFSATSGSFTISSNAGSFTVTPSADINTEGAETFTVSIRTGSISGTVVRTSNAVTINDTSTTIILSVSASTILLYEGNSITFNVSSSGVPNGTVVNWTIGHVDTYPSPTKVTNALLQASAGLEPQATDFTQPITGRAFIGDIDNNGSLQAADSLYHARWAQQSVLNPVSINDKAYIEEAFYPILRSDSRYSYVYGSASSAADFSATSGTATINNNAASFTVSAVEETSTEEDECFRVTISISTPAPRNVSAPLMLLMKRSYSVSGPSSVNEGSAATFTVSTVGVPNGTLYWTILNSTTQNADFSATSGSFTLTSGSGSFNVTAVADVSLEGPQDFQVQLRTGSTSGTVRATSNVVTINDTSVPTYAFGTIPTSINEGSSGTFNVVTTGVANGTVLYWLLGMSSTNTSDFSSITGSVTINSNAGSFTVTTIADQLTEGSEQFRAELYSNSSYAGSPLALSNFVTINDTSLTRFYTFGSISTSINEGSSGTYNVTTTNVPNSTTLYWTILHGTTNASDFSATSGSFVINSNTGSFTVTATADQLTEGNETFQIQIRTGSTSGTVVETSIPITINDTSLTRTYAFGTIPSSINEGSSGTFNVTTTNVPNSTTLYWTVNLSGNLTSSDFSATSGSFAINSNAGSFSVTTSADLTTEGAEAFTVSIRTDSVSGTVRATSNAVTINDTSLAPTYNFTTTPASINEGSAGTFVVATTGVANSTTLYWTLNFSSPVTSADFLATSGSFVVNSNSGSFTVTPTADQTTEATAETFTVSIRTGSVSGTVVRSSNAVTINDTSRTPTYAVAPNVTTVNEGGTVTFTVTTTSIPNGTILYWATSRVTGTISTDDFTDSAVTGTVTINNNTGTISRGIRNDAATEGSESFQLTIRTGSTTGTIVATSSTVTINDTSLTPPGQAIFQVLAVTTTRTTTWTAPAGVTSISILCIGGGGGGRAGSGSSGGGGGGGALTYRNNFAVTPGATYTIQIGKGGNGITGTGTGGATAGGASFFSTTSTCNANGGAGGGGSGAVWAGGTGGSATTPTGGASFAGGQGGGGQSSQKPGGGGCAGYSGVGGRGGGRDPSAFTNNNATAGAGGGGGGGGWSSAAGSFLGGHGGGVEALGPGANGAAGSNSTSGNGGAGGGNGGYGGGGAGGFLSAVSTLQNGHPGVVRIMWPGNLRSYPSTRVANE